MSFRSIATKITAENYVRVKQEAFEKQAPPLQSKTTNTSAPSPQFGPFQPQKTGLSTTTKSYLNPPINKPPTISKPTTTKSQINLPKKTSNGLMKSSIGVNKPPTISNPTITMSLNNNPSNKPAFETSNSSSYFPKNIPTTSSKSTTTKRHESNPYLETVSNTQSLGQGEQVEDVATKSSEGRENPKEKDVNATKKGTKRKKRVWKPGGKLQWLENIEVDPDEVVQVEEIQENKSPKLGMMEGTIVAKHVHCLPKGTRIVVHFNEFDQPIRKGGLVLIHFLSDISKDGTICPIGAHTWKDVDSHYKQNIVKYAYEKCVLPDRKEIRRMLLSHVNVKWKQYRWELHIEYYSDKLTKEQMIEKKPDNVIKEQWIRLISYWCSEKFKKLSALGKRARAMQNQVHTTGSRSYAQTRIDFVKENEREPTSLEWWNTTHMSKDGGYVKGTCTQEFMDTAESKVQERLRDSEETREVIEMEVFNELMYPSNKPNQRVVGYGHGITMTHVFGLEAEFRKSKMGAGGFISTEVMSIKSYLLSVERKNDEVISQLQKRNDELEKANEKNDEIISQLQERNETLQCKTNVLEKQNEALQAQNVQLLSQLERMSSVLAKIEKNQKLG